MTTIAPIATPLGPRETAPLDATAVPRPDALSALDHRTRRRAIPRHGAPGGHYLAFGNGDDEPHLIALDAKILHVGRAVSSDLRFEDPHVSRRHAIVVRYGRHVRVLDDRSSSGTFVNGVRIVATDLEDGDVVRIGPVAFAYVILR